MKKQKQDKGTKRAVKQVLEKERLPDGKRARRALAEKKMKEKEAKLWGEQGGDELDDQMMGKRKAKVTQAGTYIRSR